MIKKRGPFSAGKDFAFIVFAVGKYWCEPLGWACGRLLLRFDRNRSSYQGNDSTSEKHWSESSKGHATDCRENEKVEQ